MKLLYISLGLIALIATVSCTKKDNNPTTIALSQTNSGDTVSVSPGERVNLTIADPADSGYTFNPPQFNPQVLKLLNHYHENPVAGAPVGDYGADLWQFSAINDGSTPLAITAKLSDTTITVFKGLLNIK